MVVYLVSVMKLCSDMGIPNCLKCLRKEFNFDVSVTKIKS